MKKADIILDDYFCNLKKILENYLNISNNFAYFVIFSNFVLDCILLSTLIYLIYDVCLLTSK